MPPCREHLPQHLYPRFLTPCSARNKRKGLLTGIRKKERFVRCHFVHSRSEYVLLSSSSGGLAAPAFSQKAGRGSCRKCRDPTHLPPGRGRPSAAPRRRRRIQASLQMLPNSVQQGACARKYIAAFCELPLIIEYTINQILSTKIFRGNRKARLKPRPSSGMLPSEPCPPNGGHGAAAHLLPRTYRCRGLPQKIKAI